MKFVFYSVLMLLLLVLSCQSNPEQFSVDNHISLDSTLSFRGVFSVDKNTAWVSGSKGSVYHTENGGIDWAKIHIANTSDLDFRDIEVLSDKSVILMSAGPGDKSRIYKSTDYGISWKLKYANPHPAGFLNSIAFWDDKHGIGVGDPVNGYIFVLLTTDGGNSWEEINNEGMPKALNGECGFAASGTCVTIYGEQLAWIGSGGPAARIFRTSDKGKTWSVSETPIQSGKNSTGIISVFFMNDREGFITGGDYTNPDSLPNTYAFTEDGGISWKISQSNNLPFQSSIGTLETTKGKNLISVGPSGTYISKDKLSWKPLTKEGFHCLSVSEIDHSIWLAGSEGRVAKIKVNL